MALAGFAIGGAAFAQPPNPMLGSPSWFFSRITPTPQTDLSSRAGQEYVQQLHAVGRVDVHATLEDRIPRLTSCAPWPAGAQDRRSAVERPPRTLVLNVR